jgi:hypothetical protein
MICLTNNVYTINETKSFPFFPVLSNPLAPIPGGYRVKKGWDGKDRSEGIFYPSF